jgi:diguanylate cyclase (GGDEF)-like protein
MAEVTVLRNSPCLKNLTDPEYGAVCSLLEYCTVPLGVAVFREGEAGEGLAICLTGGFVASVGLSNGARRDLFSIQPGDFFGETAVIGDCGTLPHNLLAREPQLVTIIAQEVSDIAVLHAQDFSRILAGYPLAAIKILGNIGRQMSGRFESFAKYMDDLMRWGAIARRRAIQDDLTCLYNRRFLEDSIRDRFQHWEMGLRKMSLMMLDLDKIHAVNEQYGTRAGDMVIIAVAEVIRSVMRSTDICARLSGDEFAILLPDASGKDTFHTACRLLTAINNLVVSVPCSPDSGSPITLVPNVSIGVAEAPAHAATEEELKLAADHALHRAKANGRNRVESATVCE